MPDIFAITNRGLEQVSAAEMRCLPELQVTGVSYRRITARYQGQLADLLKLRTVDDVFIDLATWEEIGSQRSALGMLKERSMQLDLNSALEITARVRRLGPAPAFSVTANFVGRRNYTTDEIKNSLAAGITGRYPWQYTTEGQSQVNIRIFIEHQRAYLGMRLSATPLHRRAYKQAHVSGSLKPTVAAALLRIAEVSPGEGVLDPFCGAGTLLIEAALLGARACGGDHDPAALRAAQTNAERAGVRIRLHRWEAQSLPLAGHAVSRVITNLPWGRQVSANEEMSSFYRHVCTALARVIQDDGQIVLLTNLPQLVRFDHLNGSTVTEISLFGQSPSILKFTPART